MFQNPEARGIKGLFPSWRLASLRKPYPTGPSQGSSQHHRISSVYSTKPSQGPSAPKGVVSCVEFITEAAHFVGRSVTSLGLQLGLGPGPRSVGPPAGPGFTCHLPPPQC